MRELIQRKDSLVAQRATPAFFMQVDHPPPCPPTCLDPWAGPALGAFMLLLLPTKIPSLSISAAACINVHASVPACQLKATTGPLRSFKNPCSSSPLEAYFHAG